VKRILIVNLTRFGDLLQTTPTIVGLKEIYPEAEISVLVERNFADVARGLPGVGRVLDVDLDGLGRLILRNDLRTAYRFVEQVVTALRADHYDLAINYSSSRMSAVLLGLLGVRDTRGWTMTADGHRMIASHWSRLFSATCLNRRQSALNLVDCYKRIAGVTRGPERIFFNVPEDARAKASARLAEAGHQGEPLVAFQLGASRSARVWPPASFVAVGRELANRLGARLLLCGGRSDREYADEIARELGPLAIDVCGRTSIAELGALLERSAVMVTPDTGPMHMAVAVGTPVVALFFGPALPFDTGPYAPDQLCLHAEVACAPCDHHVTCLEPFCRDTIEPAAVVEAVMARQTGDWAALGALADRWPKIRWYRTGFDPEGLFDVSPLGQRPLAAYDALRRVYRAFWKTVLEGTPPVPPPYPLPRHAATVRELVPLAREGAVAAREVEALARHPVDLQRLEAAAQALEEIDYRIFRFGAMYEPATLLVQVFRFEKENIEGDDVAALATATRVLHEQLESNALLLADMLDPSPTRHASHGGQHASVA
jgi:ADP-heptose:LPS heptosyltransferase